MATADFGYWLRLKDDLTQPLHAAAGRIESFRAGMAAVFAAAGFGLKVSAERVLVCEGAWLAAIGDAAAARQRLTVLAAVGGGAAGGGAPAIRVDAPAMTINLDGRAVYRLTSAHSAHEEHLRGGRR